MEMQLRFVVCRWSAFVLLVTALLALVGCPGPPATETNDVTVDQGEPATGPSTNNTDPEGSSGKLDDPEASDPPQTGTGTPPKPSQGSVTPEPGSTTSEPGSTISEPGRSAEPSYEDWTETPQFALVITGRQHGYVEPCGCTGLENQKGGLARRHTLLQRLEKKNWPLVPIDVGNLVRRTGPQARLKYQLSIDSLKTMKYRSVGLGPDDLRLPSDLLLSMMVDDGDATSPIASANVTVLAKELTQQYQVVDAGDKKIGIAMVLGGKGQEGVFTDVDFQTPKEGLEEVWPKLQEEGCDFHVLLAFTSVDDAKAIAKEFPQFQVVITSGHADLPTIEPERIEMTDTLLIQTGKKGMYAGVLGVFDDETNRLRYARVALDASYEDSPLMRALFKSYQSTLQQKGLAGLEVRPLPHPSGAEFVGSKACNDCHEEAYKVWENSPHHHATESLVHPAERGDVPRHFDPECLSCHVTGWNPQRYYPYESGYQSIENLLLHGSGCENCHGPGSRHVAAESGSVDATDAEVDELRKAMRLTLAKAKSDKCLECHDLDNSPDFHDDGAFEKYWERIKH